MWGLRTDRLTAAELDQGIEGTREDEGGTSLKRLDAETQRQKERCRGCTQPRIE